MFGHRYYGSRHFGPRYFGDGGGVVVAPPVSTGQSFTQRRRLRRERLQVEIELIATFSASVESILRMREAVAVEAKLDGSAAQRLKARTKADLSIETKVSGEGVITEYNELEELAILGLL